MRELEGEGKADKERKAGGHGSVCAKRRGAHIPLSSRPHFSGALNEGRILSLFWSWVPREIFKVAPSGPLARIWGRAEGEANSEGRFLPISELVPGAPELETGLSQRRLLSERVDARLGIAPISVRNGDKGLEKPSGLASDPVPTLPPRRRFLSTSLWPATEPRPQPATLQACLNSNPDFPLFLLGLQQQQQQKCGLSG